MQIVEMCIHMADVQGYAIAFTCYELDAHRVCIALLF